MLKVWTVILLSVNCSKDLMLKLGTVWSTSIVHLLSICFEYFFSIFSMVYVIFIPFYCIFPYVHSIYDMSPCFMNILYFSFDVIKLTIATSCRMIKCIFMLIKLECLHFVLFLFLQFACISLNLMT